MIYRCIGWTAEGRKFFWTWFGAKPTDESLADIVRGLNKVGHELVGAVAINRTTDLAVAFLSLQPSSPSRLQNSGQVSVE